MSREIGFSSGVFLLAPWASWLIRAIALKGTYRMLPGESRLALVFLLFHVATFLLSTASYIGMAALIALSVSTIAVFHFAWSVRVQESGSGWRDYRSLTFLAAIAIAPVCFCIVGAHAVQSISPDVDVSACSADGQVLILMPMCLSLALWFLRNDILRVSAELVGPVGRQSSSAKSDLVMMLVAVLIVEFAGYAPEKLPTIVSVFACFPVPGV